MRQPRSTPPPNLSQASGANGNKTPKPLHESIHFPSSQLMTSDAGRLEETKTTVERISILTLLVDPLIIIFAEILVKIIRSAELVEPSIVARDVIPRVGRRTRTNILPDATAVYRIWADFRSFAHLYLGRIAVAQEQSWPKTNWVSDEIRCATNL